MCQVTGEMKCEDFSLETMKDSMTEIQREQCRFKKIQWKVAAYVSTYVFNLDVLTFLGRNRVAGSFRNLVETSP